MGALLTTGTVTRYDESKLRFAAGFSDHARAIRALGVSAEELSEGNIPMEFPVQLAYSALRRSGLLENVGYEEFLDTVANVEIDDDPESEGPPA